MQVFSNACKKTLPPLSPDVVSGSHRISLAACPAWLDLACCQLFLFLYFAIVDVDVLMFCMYLFVLAYYQVMRTAFINTVRIIRWHYGFWGFFPIVVRKHRPGRSSSLTLAN